MNAPADAHAGSATGWRDAHLHLFAHGEQTTCIPLADCRSLAECLDRVAAACATLRPDEWVRAACARAEAWPERRLPTARELDRACAGRPAFVRSFDLHAASASSAALALARITRDTPDPPGGRIVRDARAQPDGRLLETASALLRAAIPAFSASDQKSLVRAAVRDLRARGFVEVHDMLAQVWLGPTLAALIDEGDAAANSMRFLLYAPLEDIEGAWAASGAWERGNLRLAGAKVFLDGTLNSRTAWLLSDYADPLPNLPRGQSLFTDDALDAAIRRADTRGYPLAMHAIGDAAVRQALDALERVKPRSPGFRIEHCQFVDPDDAPRFAQLRVVASPQPCHLLADVEALRARTPRLLDRAFPLRALWDAYAAAGLRPAEWMWFGSDTPVVDPNRDDNEHAAVERRRRGSPAADAIGPRQALSNPEALACMRTGAAAG